MRKNRLFLPIVILLVSWAGGGMQLYFIHVNHVQQREIKDAMQRLEGASRRLDDARRHVEEETERLQKLLKMLPPQPVPDHTSKL